MPQRSPGGDESAVDPEGRARLAIGRNDALVVIDGEKKWHVPIRSTDQQHPRQRRVLERIASGAALEEVLVTLVELIEDQVADMRCAVLLANAAQTRLRFAAAPSLPDDLKRGMDPFLNIAPDSGSCGIASYRKAPVYVSGTATGPMWRKGRDVLVRNGVRATRKFARFGLRDDPDPLPTGRSLLYFFSMLWSGT